MIDKKKIEYYNSVSRQYVEMLTVCDYGDFDDVVYDKDGTTAIPGVNIIDMVSTQNDDNGDYISVEYIKNGILYSLSEDNCSIINRCVTDVYKSIKKSVTYATVQKEVYNWIVFSKIGEMDILLGDYIEKRLTELTDTYTCYFRMPYTEIAGNGSLTIAGIRIGTCKELDKYWGKVESAIVSKDTKNDVFASVTMQGEVSRVRELAYEKAQLAVDIIKINSWLRFEYNPILATLDIDKNIIGMPCTLTLTHKAGEEKLNVEHVVRGQKYVIDGSFIAILKRSMLNQFVLFMESYYNTAEHTELDTIIKRSISKYNKALSTENIHERVVAFCSILDAMILSDNEVGIKESLKKYIPVLISDNLEQRKEWKNSINEMYDNRSQYIHHGKEPKISQSQIVRYSGIVYCTLARLIGMRKKYKSVKEIQSDLDDMMMGVSI